jgi:NADPH:quinone reductase
MRAAVIRDGELVVEERPDPEPGDGELLVRVRAAGVNNADLAQRAGHYPAPPGAPADIPGLEAAGEVVPTGERVLALLGGGGQAELVTVNAQHVLPMPDNVEWPVAGGFMEAYATAHDALVTQAELRPGERLLVNGAAGGVGTAAVQLGLALGADVTGTTRGDPEPLRALGAATDATGSYDVILELVGGPNWPGNLKALNTRGRICVIGVGAGAKVELNLQLLMAKRGRITASTLRARPLEDKADASRRVETSVLPGFGRGLTVPIARTFGLEEAADAYAFFQEPGKHGKVVLLP